MPSRRFTRARCAGLVRLRDDGLGRTSCRAQRPLVFLVSAPQVTQGRSAGTSQPHDPVAVPLLGVRLVVPRLYVRGALAVWLLAALLALTVIVLALR